MRNAVSLLKHYPDGTALSRTAAVGLILAAYLTGVDATATSVGAKLLLGAPDRRPEGRRLHLAATALAAQLPGHPDPALAAILLPRHAPPGTYRLTVIDQPIEAARTAVMTALAPTVPVDDPPGAWAIRPADPLESFGKGGIYDRSRLARLFAGKPVQVLRGPVERNGALVASVTLLSPCPDAQLSRLSPATIAILFDVAAARPR